MPKTWFTADTHFGHSNIIRHCTRPFGTVEEMDASLIATWNAVVRKDDDIWHLGDFAYRAAKAPADYLRRLNGRKHFVWGNHDTEQSKAAPGWASSQAYAEITVRHADVAGRRARSGPPLRPQPRSSPRGQPVLRCRCRRVGLPSCDAIGDPNVSRNATPACRHRSS
jgi:hypothetical protein